MAAWVALLRGVNVGGKNSLPMERLAADLMDAGCVSVKTYIQSGNVVFTIPRATARSLSDRIAATIETRHGFRPGVHVLSASDFERGIARNPYGNATVDPKSLHMFFLATKPTAGAMTRLQELRAESERISLRDHVLYLHAPSGIGRSKLAANVEKRLGVAATARNWRTVTKISELIHEIS